MAGVNYFQIQEQVAALIREHTSAAVVTVDGALAVSAESTPWVGIYLTRRDAPASEQRLSGGRSTAYNVRLSIWVYCWGLEPADTAKVRDDLVAEIEREMMEHRSELTHNSFWFEGGEFENAQDDGAFMRGAEIIMVVPALSTV